MARELVRAFATWFQLVNVAEKVHRIRRRREYFQQDSERPQPGGRRGRARGAQGRGADLERGAAAARRTVDRAGDCWRIRWSRTRRTTLRRQQRLAALLLERDNASARALRARARCSSAFAAEISADWQTEEHPRERLTVADEREHAIFYLAEILYRIVPAFYQEIADRARQALRRSERETLELPVIVRFGSWVGGDMDSSADVHAKSIRETLARAQQVIISNYHAECLELAQMLSQSASRVGI